MDRLNLIAVQNRLIKDRVSIFSIRDFVRIFKVLPKTARAFLSYHSKRSFFMRVKQGIYVSIANPPTKFEIANYIYKPSYISFETALSYHGVIPETIYTTTSATSKNSREVIVLDQSYQYYRIKKKLFFGYRPIKIRDKLIFIADKEKALLDYLYIRGLKKQQLSERLDLRKIDKKKLGTYVQYFKRSLRKSSVLINQLEIIKLNNIKL